MRDILCPVYCNICSDRLVPQQSKSLSNEGQPSWDVEKEQGGHEDGQQESDFLANAAIRLDIF